MFIYQDVFLSLKIVSISANSECPDKMQHHAAFYLGLHCLPKVPINGFPVLQIVEETY